jgi:hypothetical protein
MLSAKQTLENSQEDYDRGQYYAASVGDQDPAGTATQQKADEWGEMGNVYAREKNAAHKKYIAAFGEEGGIQGAQQKGLASAFGFPFQKQIKKEER